DQPRRRLWPRNGDPAPLDPPSGPIDNSHRTLGASLSRRAVEAGERSVREYEGSAGQSFGAWLADGVELTLRGEANDYVGKGMAGGVIAIRPYEHDAAANPVLAGNTCLYGATGGCCSASTALGPAAGSRSSYWPTGETPSPAFARSSRPPVSRLRRTPSTALRLAIESWRGSGAGSPFSAAALNSSTIRR